MHFLIDGHNLIGQLPDIDLADPDDEQQLVNRLRRWAAADARRRVTVVFDGGLLRGIAHHLSDAQLTVIFAAQRQTADALLIRRLESLSNPAEFTLVSSDRAIVRIARERRVPVLTARQFGAQLAPRRPPPPPPAPSPKEAPQLSAEEVAAWLAEFGPEPAPRRRRRRSSRPAGRTTGSPAPDPPPPPRPADQLKESGAALTEAELAEWLAIFAAVEASPPEPDRAGRKRRRPARPASHDANPGSRPPDERLSQAEIDEWLDRFGADEAPGDR